ncbi:MAG: beta-lactamase family protein, partial [Acidobacteria bacterium]|nr:beta-lactamase family protein [Acidobacteriota bacterium]
KGLGVRDRGSNAPVTADTVFRIASMTKSFTVLATLKLRDEGKLSLDDSVSKWIPEFARVAYPTRDTAPIRVRQLLTHGTGLPEDNPWGDRQLAVSDATLARWLEQGLPFSTPPGTAYEYSNYGFALAGRIVSKASGVPYREYLEKQILAPLGMRASTLEVSAVAAALRATGYRKSGDTYVEVPPLAHGAFGAMGGLLTSARDLARYVAFQLSAYPPRDEEERGPVRRSSLREMQRLWRPSGLAVDRPSPGDPLKAVASGYGYGLGVSQDCRFRHIVGHGGGLPGFGSYMMWLPEYGVGMFAMANLTYAGPRPPIDQAFDILSKTGALQARELPAAPALLATREAIVRLWRHWTEREAADLAADNLFQDSPAEARRQEIEKIKIDVGECRAGDLRPENWLRGAFRMPCARGFVDVAFTLAPTAPPKVQYLRFAAGKPPGRAMKAAAEAVASGSLAESNLRALVATLHKIYGACRVGETLGGNGSTEARLRFDCDRGPADVRLRMGAGEKLREVVFTRPPQVSCVP